MFRNFVCPETGSEAKLFLALVCVRLICYVCFSWKCTVCLLGFPSQFCRTSMSVRNVYFRLNLKTPYLFCFSLNRK
ncbi:hypothetical protein BRADI_1g56533v3 [Brachypodium distachyon]|uniref:Uncharacterized protein n=1 Tax=Brachypodium distachyon TaxID=15368 RepID=A0A2K2DRR8_BRADI|nr:hypothetical protein BRADI_1g56533v3 [Brachypodium distachyon]